VVSMSLNPTPNPQRGSTAPEGADPDLTEAAWSRAQEADPARTETTALEWPTAAWSPPDRPRGQGRTALVGAVSGALAGAMVAGVVLVARPSAPGKVAAPQPSTAPASPLSGGSIDVRSIVAKVEPAVASITSSLGFGRFGGRAAGTGMILTGDGEVLTNAHVVEGGQSIQVAIPSRGTFPARVLGADAVHDVALLKVDAVSALPTVTFSTTPPQVGDPVVAIGNALALNGSPTVTTGIVSALDRQIDTASESLSHLIQTDAPINPGDSGGPLLNASGQVIGMNTAIAGNAQNIGFAIPVSQIQPLLAQLAQGGGSAAGRAYLGVSLADASPGAVVTAVVAGSPADSAGLRPGDVVTSVDGTAVQDAAGLVSVIRSHRPGDRLSLTVRRGSSTRTVRVTLGSAPQQLTQ
jgi:S1-C subfamily serine protease